MGYADTTGVIIYYKPYQHFVIQIDHHFWFDEYNSRLSIEYNNTPGSSLLWQYPEGHIHDSDLLNLIPCELDLTSTPFSDTTIVTYEIELPPSIKKVGLIYWIMNTFKSHTSLIKSPIHGLVVNFHHRLREICGSYLSMGESLSQLKVYLMNSIVIKLHG